MLALRNLTKKYKSAIKTIHTDYSKKLRGKYEKHVPAIHFDIIPKEDYRCLPADNINNDYIKYRYFQFGCIKYLRSSLWTDMTFASSLLLGHHLSSYLYKPVSIGLGTFGFISQYNNVKEPAYILNSGLGYLTLDNKLKRSISNLMIAGSVGMTMAYIPADILINTVITYVEALSITQMLTYNIKNPLKLINYTTCSYFLISTMLLMPYGSVILHLVNLFITHRLNRMMNRCIDIHNKGWPDNIKGSGLQIN